MVARIRGEGSPTFCRHSLLMNSVTAGGKLWKWALTLFLRMRPLRDRVGSSGADGEGGTILGLHQGAGGLLHHENVLIKPEKAMLDKKTI